ncbi:hypothetical protein BJX63DRAFT_390900 [Aspergillus granulosus]|uniref:Subtelomeric hrmA-associated cluster protein AFUB-079030/YDR124W-like helical bundle domain-containing protein n=1 Tax=Aspergillus granulosus TaxID=176169 RepID=A0ABR4HHI9_9EURO
MQFTIPYSHFAVMYVDSHGEIQVEASPSVMGYEKAVFTEEVQEKFLKLANGEWQPNLSRLGIGLSNSNNTSWHHPSQNAPSGLIRCEWQLFQHHKRHRRGGVRRVDPASGPGWEPPSPSPSLKRSTLRVGQTKLLRKYYEMAFENFQQVNCKVVAKAWIKLVEPRKQVNHPYNGRINISGSTEVKNPEATKPKWWPSGVTHKEPDHLGKPERVRLLVHILCELRDSHGITAQKLKEAGQDVSRQVSPEIRLQVLDEIYYVRGMEELYLDGKISTVPTRRQTKRILEANILLTLSGGDTTINVSHVHIEEDLQEQILASGARDQLTTIPPSQQDHLSGHRSHRIMPTVSDDPYQLPLRSTKRPANSDNHLPMSPSLSPSVSRKSSLERSMPTFSSGIDPAILSGSEPSKSPACPRGLQPVGATSIPEYFANQFPPSAGHNAHPAFWDAMPNMHPQFAFPSY